MKKLILFVSVILLVHSCTRQSGDSSELGKLVGERDSLKSLQKEISSQISDLEERIARLDTSDKKEVALVTSMKLQPRKFEHYFEVQANVESDKTVNINAELPGIVKQIPVSAGQPVSQGQTLIILDTEIIKKNIEEVKTAYDLAKTVYQKQETLWSQKIGSEIQYLEAKNRKESLELKLSTLNSQLEKSIITAPFSGVVDEIFIKQGEVASPMLPLARLVNLEEVYLKADVSEDYIGKVKNGTTAKAHFPSLGISVDGKVSFTGNFINPNNRTFRINVKIPNTDGMLKPNLLSNISILDFDKDSAIVLPSDIILQDALNNEYVFVIEKNGTAVAKKKIVGTGLTYRGETMIKEGLAAGEEIVLEGARNVRDGEEVAPVEMGIKE